MTLRVGARSNLGSYQPSQFDSQDHVISQDTLILWLGVPHGKSLQVWWQ